MRKGDEEGEAKEKREQPPKRRLNGKGRVKTKATKKSAEKKSCRGFNKGRKRLVDPYG